MRIIERSRDKNRTDLFIPLGLVLWADIILTLLLQPGIYWFSHSDYNEWNPIAGIFLGTHPLLFFILGLGYIVLIYIGVVTLEKNQVVGICLWVATLHVWPAINWLHGALLLFVKNIPSPQARNNTAFFIEVLCFLAFIGWTYGALKRYPNTSES